ncbi:MAG: DNA cytosine methyltransferase [Beijerinckiaceae bacterium]|nr:DNA cytosine methyltransferase [Beijerinckiaceae bacterium]
MHFELISKYDVLYQKNRIGYFELNKKYKVLDLFCGAGGLSLGLSMTGRFKTVAAVDFWKPACDTFQYNHPEIKPELIFNADINQLIVSGELEDICKKNGPFDLVVGGPPCQGLSLAGKRIQDDPRNQLFKSFVKAVEIARPKAFIMENVPGLLSMQSGLINKAVLEAFKEIGYNHFENHQPAILKAEKYGVPQIRRRLFYIGFDKNIDLDQDFTWPPEPTHSDEKKVTNIQQQDLFGSQITIPHAVTVEDAISDLPSIKSGEGSDVVEYSLLKPVSSLFQSLMRDWSMCSRNFERPMLFNHEASKHTPPLIKLIEVARPGASVDPKYTDSRKWDPKSPGYTVKALGAGGGSTNRRAFHYDPHTPRGSTIRENARIQSFPDWYRFIGPKTHQMTQVGNAVPPLLAKAIGLTLSKFLDKQ